MCKKVEYLLTEMQYDIHNYVFSQWFCLINRNVFITLKWDIYIYITMEFPSTKVDILWRHVSTVAEREHTAQQNAIHHYLEREAAESWKP